MSAVLVDTDVFSFLLKRDTRASLYRAHLAGKRLALSFMTLAELYGWVIERQWGPARVADLRAQLQHYIILHSDDAVAQQYAAVRNLKGVPVNQGDAWIAATALRHAIPLVTHNRKHFEPIPQLAVISEA